MFFFVRTIREKLIMAGVILSFAMMLLLSIRLLFLGGFFEWCFAALFAAVPLMVFKGNRAGYSLAKFIVGLFAVTLIGGALNPFTYGDFVRSKGNYPLFASVMVLIGLLMIFAFYGLEEHLKLRDREEGQVLASNDEH